jgi:hypothetical protein
MGGANTFPDGGSPSVKSLFFLDHPASRLRSSTQAGLTMGDVGMREYGMWNEGTFGIAPEPPMMRVHDDASGG